MRVLGRCIASTPFVTGLLAMLVVVPAPALAQFDMMGGGGHDHSAMQGGRAPKPSGSERKLRHSIDRVLSDEQGRTLLSDAVLNDRAFMDSLIRRIAAVPEWRAMAVRQLGAPELAGPVGKPSQVAPGGDAIVYACPMHSDVTAPGPADCPRCGMALVRRAPRNE